MTELLLLIHTPDACALTISVLVRRGSVGTVLECQYETGQDDYLR